ncbi:hypothetical protein [Mesorhizobium sp.]|uniref:hypothetical protein n=1 Tax=Mesorhizobium sp. TaxID=1871066 RepID=UPI00121E76E5|nr:hypothetical protein [Mesorhizobium sp.]TIL44782.1 MAG: hypothetical protein E5Y86_15045 [Mesorhizobium sp.]
MRPARPGLQSKKHTAFAVLSFVSVPSCAVRYAMVLRPALYDARSICYNSSGRHASYARQRIETGGESTAGIAKTKQAEKPRLRSLAAMITTNQLSVLGTER